MHLTIICPVYNEASVVPLFFARLAPVVKALSARYKVDVLFLNNASTDGTIDAISALRAENPFVYVITLSANVGYQRSIECGLRNAKGDLITFIDVDCEDPPEMIPQFVQGFEQGYDIVYGERVAREENRVMVWLRKLFYRVVYSIADEDFILDMAEFALLSAEVRDAIIVDQSSFPFIRSSIARVGFKRLGIPYKRQRRIGGRTHYNFMQMTIFAVAGILAASTLGLRLPIYIFPFWLVLTGVLGAIQIQTGNPWIFLMNVLLACAYVGGTVAFVALYVARTYKNGLGRPNYVIHKRYSHLQTD
ncbi:MAG TPA: glycosyltransferase family 2 protein [Burkholderiales bacterium]|nr:glycosyltransferase family 2 protein [Burkholderiales bacterium]